MLHGLVVHGLVVVFGATQFVQKINAGVNI